MKLTRTDTQMTVWSSFQELQNHLKEKDAQLIQVEQTDNKIIFAEILYPPISRQLLKLVKSLSDEDAIDILDSFSVAVGVLQFEFEHNHHLESYYKTLSKFENELRNILAFRDAVKEQRITEDILTRENEC